MYVQEGERTGFFVQQAAATYGQAESGDWKNSDARYRTFCHEKNRDLV